ncbi:putative mandelate racemase / muconate lactonizing enzyme [Klebsiella pneumoniae]|uniref:Putative mandelate racemase / muconate lactonizing enzyme n=1 Tax=Klebsiella pneumoniae TaxID=573 RepID=A0A378G1T9_KLEPN|nr:putative mandelate racemase / muconate lactonizing enzyme [Klebsiella pneumoniae]
MSSYAWLAENLSIPIVGPESFGGKHHMARRMGESRGLRHSGAPALTAWEGLHRP